MPHYEPGHVTQQRNADRAARQNRARNNDRAKGKINPVTTADVRSRHQTGQSKGLIRRLLG